MLAAAGIGDVTVYERGDELHEIGAGIQLSPNGTRIMHGLGLGDALDAVAVRPAARDVRRWEDWSLLSTSPLGDVVVAEYGFAYYHVHRVDLHRLFADGVTPGYLKLGRRLVGFDSAGHGVELRFADGSSATADVVVGADGIHSVVRQSCSVRSRLASRATRHRAAWSPQSGSPDLQLPVASTVVMGPGHHFVYYFVSAGRYVNWVGIAPSETWTLESWTAPGRLEDALGDFAGSNTVVRRLIAEAADASDRAELYRWALYDRDPLPRWGEGPVTMLGDAAHPMLPFMGQGACQAIEDAAVLAACLRRLPDPVQALRYYEDLRRERTARIQLAARTTKPSSISPTATTNATATTAWPRQREQTVHRNSWLFDTTLTN